MSTFSTKDDLDRLRTEMRAELRKELRAERDRLAFDIKFSMLITLFYLLVGSSILFVFLYALLHPR